MKWLLLTRDCLTKYTHFTTTRKMNASFAVEVNLILPTNLYYIKAISNQLIDIRIYKKYFSV